MYPSLSWFKIKIFRKQKKPIQDLSEELGDINDQPEIEDVPILEDEEGDIEPAGEPEVIPESEPEAEPEVEKEADAEPEPSAEPGIKNNCRKQNIQFSWKLWFLIVL